MSTREKRSSHHLHFSKADLLNAMPVEEIRKLIQNELDKYAKPQDLITGCIPSTRWVNKKIGGYPVIQIPKKYWPHDFLNRTEAKGQYKVMVHQLAFRATGNLLPSYNEGFDITHTCGNGKVLPKKTSNPSRPCITKQHLSISLHHRNMEAQRCKPLVDCENCKLFTRRCDHEPACYGGDKQEKEYNLQKSEVKEITVTYRNGKTVRINFN
jgi:hypothetical protein